MGEFQFSGAILGIDHGLKVIGLALSQTGYFARPYGLIQRSTNVQDLARIKQIIQKEKITAIVVGLPPVPPDFTGYSQADTVKNWAKKLYAEVTVPIYLWDEGLSSVDAEELLDDSGKGRPERVDAHAAAVILQSCLDAVQEGHLEPPRFVPQ